jgi:hypothetical protein
MKTIELKQLCDELLSYETTNRVGNGALHELACAKQAELGVGYTTALSVICQIIKSEAMRYVSRHT